VEENTHPKESYTQRKRDYKAKRDKETEKQNEAKNHILSDHLSVSLSLCLYFLREGVKCDADMKKARMGST
jgi:hypothetical protein